MIQVLDKLANGYTVIAAVRDDDLEEGSWVVLATDGTEYATWRASDKRNTYWGHYFALAEIEAAVADFKKRVG